MSGINCLFDASPIVLLIFVELYTQVGVSRRALFLAYAIVCLFLFAVLCPLWFVELRTTKRQQQQQQQQQSDDAKELAVARIDVAPLSTTTTTNTTAESAATTDVLGAPATVSVAQSAVELTQTQTNTPHTDTDTQTQTQTPAQAQTPQERHAFVDPLTQQSLKAQLLSYPFWFSVVFMAIQSNRSIFFVGTLPLSDSVHTALSVFLCLCLCVSASLSLCLSASFLLCSSL